MQPTTCVVHLMEVLSSMWVCEYQKLTHACFTTTGFKLAGSWQVKLGAVLVAAASSAVVAVGFIMSGKVQQ